MASPFTVKLLPPDHGRDFLHAQAACFGSRTPKASASSIKECEHPTWSAHARWGHFWFPQGQPANPERGAGNLPAEGMQALPQSHPLPRIQSHKADGAHHRLVRRHQALAIQLEELLVVLLLLVLLCLEQGKGCETVCSHVASTPENTVFTLSFILKLHSFF